MFFSICVSFLLMLVQPGQVMQEPKQAEGCLLMMDNTVIRGKAKNE